MARDKLSDFKQNRLIHIREGCEEKYISDEAYYDAWDGCDSSCEGCHWCHYERNLCNKCYSTRDLKGRCNDEGCIVDGVLEG